MHKRRSAGKLRKFGYAKIGSELHVNSTTNSLAKSINSNFFPFFNSLLRLSNDIRYKQNLEYLQLKFSNAIIY